MRKVMSHVCIGIMVLSLGFAMNPVFGGDNSAKDQANWDRLKQLSPGQEIQVAQNGTKSIRGNFHTVTEEAIVLSLASGEQTISRQSVDRISTKGKGHRGRNALIGVGIGAGAGAVGGAAYGEGCLSGGVICFSRGASIGVGIVLGAIVCAIIGAVIPSGGWHDIYKAR